MDHYLVHREDIFELDEHRLFVGFALPFIVLVVVHVFLIPAPVDLANLKKNSEF
jgi:hypothetical protein